MYCLCGTALFATVLLVRGDYRLSGFVSILVYDFMYTSMFAVNTFAFCFHVKDLQDPSPQRVHLTPTALKEGQSPDLIPPANRDRNQVHLGKDHSLNPLLPGKG